MAKVKKNRVLIDPKFIDDVCRRCDKWMAEIKSHHGTVQSDVIYKSSAAWREQPIQFAYRGQGDRADLRYDTESTEIDISICSSFFRNLVVVADVLWEMGLTLHFDEYGRHAVDCSVVEVLVDEDDI